MLFSCFEGEVMRVLYDLLNK